MNKPIEQRSPNAPEKDTGQAQKGSTVSGNQPHYKTDPSSQKPGAPQTAKDERPQQKLAQGEAQVASKEPKKS
ncbi:hypothetical protein AAFN46_02895 [Pseudomonas sp. CAU 1711]|uniref:hypothetical protein n=1 Tax=Pseudomonas sp. CAU 1711 TaxID=3140356 RepID=UPI003261ABD7